MLAKLLQNNFIVGYCLQMAFTTCACLPSHSKLCSTKGMCICVFSSISKEAGCGLNLSDIIVPTSFTFTWYQCNGLLSVSLTPRALFEHKSDVKTMHNTLTDDKPLQNMLKRETVPTLNIATVRLWAKVMTHLLWNMVQPREDWTNIVLYPDPYQSESNEPSSVEHSPIKRGLNKYSFVPRPLPEWARKKCTLHT